MTEIIIIELIKDGFVSAFGNIWVVATILSLILLLLMVGFLKAPLIETLFFISVPFIIAGFSQIIDIKWIPAVFLILGGLILFGAVWRTIKR